MDEISIRHFGLDFRHFLRLAVNEDEGNVAGGFGLFEHFGGAAAVRRQTGEINDDDIR